MPLQHFPSNRYKSKKNYNPTYDLEYHFVGDKENFTFNKSYRISSVRMSNGNIYCYYYTIKNDIGEDIEFEDIEFDRVFLSGMTYKRFLDTERNSKIESLIEK